MLPAMSRDEILAEIIERPRDAYVPVPDTQVIVRPGWQQLVTPSLKRGGMNDVSLAQLADDDSADAIIDATIAQYAAIDCTFVWRVGPDSSAHLAARLAARGLVHGVTCGMARSTDMAVERDARVTIEHVDESNVDVYTRTMAAGWDMDPGPVTAINELVVRMPDPSHHLFLACYDGEPAATAALAMFARSVYLIGGVTLAAFRGRGLYRALVATRLAFARARGILLATSHARAETSAPILERLGFETLCRYDNFSSAR